MAGIARHVHFSLKIIFPSFLTNSLKWMINYLDVALNQIMKLFKLQFNNNFKFFFDRLIFVSNRRRRGRKKSNAIKIWII